MSTSDAPRPGWYADPQNPRQLRWWDGAVWTEHVSAAQAVSAPAPDPAYPSAQPYTGGATPQASAPAGTRTNTPWIWLVLFLPLLPALPVLFIDWGGMFRIDPSTGEPDRTAVLGLLTSPAYLLSLVGGWVLYGASVVFAYLDWRELGRRGLPTPFHWAWTFLSSYVYPIGRAVVVKRRTGRSDPVLWVAIGLIVLGFLFGIGLSIWIVVSVAGQVPFS